MVNKNNYKYAVMLMIPLILSAYTHLWNPIGFPAVWVVEGQYMQRAMQILNGLGFHEPKNVYPHPYDHPYFGQFFLAGLLAMVGYPSSFVSSSSSGVNVTTIETLYLIPRLVMGSLAILDTFLIYKISERRYNSTVALIASILFAVMPFTWLMRKILLETLLLPLLLSSILLAIHISKKVDDDKKQHTLYNKRQPINEKKKKWGYNRNILLALLSGVLLGLTIFTKIPAFTMIPLVGYIVFSSSKSWKYLGIWLVPIVLIPLIWPMHATYVGEFDQWLKDVGWNSQRQDVDLDKAVSSILLNSFKYVFQMDPVFLLLSIAGLVYSQIKRDYFVLLWAIPFFLFLFVINFVSFFHLIPIFPIFCISVASMVVDLSNKFKSTIRKVLPFVIISTIGIFGITSTTLIIDTNVTSNYYKAYAHIVNQLANEKKDKNDFQLNNPDLIGRHWTRGFLWIPTYVFNMEVDFKQINRLDSINLSRYDDNFLLLVDNELRKSLFQMKNKNKISHDILYKSTHQMSTVVGVKVKYDKSQYPYHSMLENNDIKWLQIRANSNSEQQ